jgi:hypothetical protein
MGDEDKNEIKTMADEIVAENDKDGDGCLSKEEFFKAFGFQASF